MTGPENYREAEKCLSASASVPIDTGEAGFYLQLAQVHATLALAAATAADGTAHHTWAGVAW